MIEEYKYLTTGPALANLLTEVTLDNEQGMEGFLLGEEKYETIKNITDNSDNLEDHLIHSLIVKGFIELSLEDRLNLFTLEGTYNEIKLKTLLKEDFNSLIGYFKYYPNFKHPLSPSIRITELMNQLKHQTKNELSTEFDTKLNSILFLSLKGSNGEIPNSTHQISYKAFTLGENKQYKSVPLQIINLMDFAISTSTSMNNEIKTTLSDEHYSNLIAPSSSISLEKLQRKMNKPDPTKLTSTHFELFCAAYDTYKELLKESLLSKSQYNSSSQLTSPTSTLSSNSNELQTMTNSLANLNLNRNINPK